MKGCLHRLGFLLFLAALFLGAAFGMASFCRPADDSARTVRFEVPKNTTLRTIAERLEQQGLVRNRYAFMLMARIMGDSNHLKAGEYELQPRMSLIDISERLT